MQYITSTMTQPTILGYLCPHCGSPILLVARIHASARKTFSFSRDTAKKVTDQAAKQLIALELERIRSCVAKKWPLSSVGPHAGKRLSDCLCIASIEAFDTPCPHCHQHAPWQHANSYSSTVAALQPQHLPTVFPDMQDTVRWLHTVHRSNRTVRAENAIAFPPEPYMEPLPPLSPRDLFPLKDLRPQQTCTVSNRHRYGVVFDYEYYPDDPTATTNARFVSTFHYLLRLVALLCSVGAVMWYSFAIGSLFKQAMVDNFLQAWAFLLLISVIHFFSIWKSPKSRKKAAGTYFLTVAILLCLLLLPLAIYAI